MFGVLSPVMLSVELVPVSDAVVRSSVVGADGARASTTIADDPAMLFAPVGTVVAVIVFPAMSIGAEVKTKLDTVRSAELCPDATV